MYKSFISSIVIVTSTFQKHRASWIGRQEKMYRFIIYVTLFEFSTSFTCKSFNESSTLPSLPASYTMMSEVKNIITKQTYFMKEHNDFKSNKRAIEFSLWENKQWKKYRKLYNYDIDEERDIKLTGSTIKCYKSGRISTNFWTKHHAPSMEDVLQVGARYGNGSYRNETMIRNLR